MLASISEGVFEIGREMRRIGRECLGRNAVAFGAALGVVFVSVWLAAAVGEALFALSVGSGAAVAILSGTQRRCAPRSEPGGGSRPLGRPTGR